MNALSKKNVAIEITPVKIRQCSNKLILIDRGINSELIEIRVHPFNSLLRINQWQMKSNFETLVA